jgi:hypothetical protein
MSASISTVFYYCHSVLRIFHRRQQGTARCSSYFFFKNAMINPFIAYFPSLASRDLELYKQKTKLSDLYHWISSSESLISN